jgi:lipoprotein Spr
MTVGKSRQGLRCDLSDLIKISVCFFFLALVAGCSAKAVATLSGPSVAPQPAAPQASVSVQPETAACPPEQFEQAVAEVTPYREADFATVLTEDSEFAFSEDDDADYASVFDEPQAESRTYEEVEAVPSIKDIVLAQYEDWRGVRYRPGGSDYRGVDCSGLVQAIFRDAFEKELPRTSGEQKRLGEAVARDEIQPGDLLYFIDRGREHVGVAVNGKQFVHASRKKGVILSSFDRYWGKRLRHIRRILDDKDQIPQPRVGG